MLFKALVILILGLILSSLGSALYFLVKDRQLSSRMVKALTTRIVLSIALFFLLIIAGQLGLIQPHGIRAHPPSATSPEQ